MRSVGQRPSTWPSPSDAPASVVAPRLPPAPAPPSNGASASSAGASTTSCQSSALLPRAAIFPWPRAWLPAATRSNAGRARPSLLTKLAAALDGDAGEHAGDDRQRRAAARRRERVVRVASAPSAASARSNSPCALRRFGPRASGESALPGHQGAGSKSASLSGRCARHGASLALRSELAGEARAWRCRAIASATRSSIASAAARRFEAQARRCAARRFGKRRIGELAGELRRRSPTRRRCSRALPAKPVPTSDGLAARARCRRRARRAPPAATCARARRRRSSVAAPSCRWPTTLPPALRSAEPSSALQRLHLDRARVRSGRARSSARGARPAAGLRSSGPARALASVERDDARDDRRRSSSRPRAPLSAVAGAALANAERSSASVVASQLAERPGGERAHHGARVERLRRRGSALAATRAVRDARRAPRAGRRRRAVACHGTRGVDGARGRVERRPRTARRRRSTPSRRRGRGRSRRRARRSDGARRRRRRDGRERAGRAPASPSAPPMRSSSMLAASTSISSGRRRLCGGCAGAPVAARSLAAQPAQPVGVQRVDHAGAASDRRRRAPRSSACQRGASRRSTPLPGSVISTRSAAKSPISDPFGADDASAAAPSRAATPCRTGCAPPRAARRSRAQHERRRAPRRAAEPAPDASAPRRGGARRGRRGVGRIGARGSSVIARLRR